VSTHTKSTTVR